MKKALIALFGMVTLLAALPAGVAVAAGRPAPSPASTLAVYGDSPYATCTRSTLTPTCADTAQFDGTDRFVDSINADPDVGLVLDVGDIHSGKEFCTQSYDQSIFDKWARFADPLVYTPGDNEWTDCHKAAQGGNRFYDAPANQQPVDYANGDPVANLSLVRSIFFPHPGVTLGTQKRLVLSQKFLYDRRFPADANYAENVMWTQSDVLFVTLNVPGGSNNDSDTWYNADPINNPTPNTQAQIDERTQRTGADTRWLDLAFFLARIGKAKAVVIGAQADMWDPEKNSPVTGTHQDAYEPIVKSIADHTTDFAKPVLMFNGDSHVYKSDNPLDPTAACTTETGACSSVAFLHPGYHVRNFHRVVVHGSSAPMEWLELTVDPSADAPPSATAFGPFRWTRQTQALP
jgi:hypothetical protein